MSAPADTSWGEIITNGKNQCRIGISRDWANKGTYEYAIISVWFWSKLSMYDSYNRLDLACAGAYNGLENANHLLVENQTTDINVGSNGTQLLCIYEINLNKGRTANPITFNAALSGVEAANSPMYASRLYTIDALESHTVKYDANGGSGAPSSQTKWYGTVLTLSSECPTRTGYTFIGWGTSANATAVTYSAGGKYGADSDVTLYAVWKANSHTIIYDANGGTNTPEEDNFLSSDDFSLSDEIPTREGYNFLGWSLSEDTESAIYMPGDSWEEISEESYTLYAVWIKVHTVTFDGNGGLVNGYESVVMSATNGTDITVFPAAIRNYYEFLGWNDEEDGRGIYYDALTVTSDLTLYAIWQAESNCYAKVDGLYKRGITYARSEGLYRKAVKIS